MTAFARYQQRIRAIVPTLNEETVEHIATWAVDNDRLWETCAREVGNSLNCNHEPSTSDDELAIVINYVGWLVRRQRPMPASVLR